MEWTEETIQRLRAFWAEGVSTAEIGRRLGVSKNAVVGKAHRLELLARPSPIRWDSEAPRARRRGPAPPRACGPTLPPLPSLPARQVAAPPVVAAPPPPRPAPVAPPQPAAAPRPVVAPPPVRQVAPRLVTVPPSRAYGGRIVTCCWPLGEPGTPGFRFCDDSALQGKPYCEAHAALAYVKVRDRREDAA